MSPLYRQTCHLQASCGTCRHATRWRWPSSATLWPRWPTRSSSLTRAGAPPRTATNTKSSSSRPCCCATPPAVWGEQRNKRTLPSLMLVPLLFSLNVADDVYLFISPLKPLRAHKSILIFQRKQIKAHGVDCCSWNVTMAFPRHRDDPVKQQVIASERLCNGDFMQSWKREPRMKLQILHLYVWHQKKQEDCVQNKKLQLLEWFRSLQLKTIMQIFMFDKSL